MFSEFARFDLRYQLRSPVVWLVGSLFALLVFFATSTDFVRIGGDVGNVHRNAPVTIVNFIAQMDVLSMFLVAALVAIPLLRDFDLGTDEQFFSKPISPNAYVSGRTFAALLTAFIVFWFIAAGSLFGSLMPWIAPEKLGPFSFEPYVWSFLYIGLPNAIMMVALIALLATATRGLMKVYLGVISFFALAQVASYLTRDIQYETIGALLDPFGVRAISRTVKYWSATEQNTKLPPLTGLFFMNRAIWMGVSVALFAATLAFFKPQRYRGGKASARAKAAAIEASAADTATASSTTSAAAPRYDARASWGQLAEQLKFDTLGVLRGVPFLIILAVGLVLLYFNATGILKLFGTTAYPETQLMVQGIEGVNLFLLMIVFGVYAGELVWRERDAGIANVTDAMPMADWIPSVAKFGALFAVAVIFVTADALECIVVQVVKGGVSIQPLLYAKGLGIDIANYFLVAIIGLTLQIVCNSKVLGYSLFVLVILLQPIMAGFHFEHNLYIFGGVPATPYSVMNGYGHFLKGWFWFQTYWTLFAVALFAISTAFWVRGTAPAWRARCAEAWRKLHGPAGVLAGVLGAAFIGVGAYIFYNTNILNEYLPSDAVLDRQARYEKTYRKYKDAPVPRITDVRVDVDIFPQEQRVEIEGTYKIKNTNSVPLTELYVQVNPLVTVKELDLGLADLTVDDKEMGFRVYELKSPLPPEAMLTIGYKLERSSEGFRNDGLPPSTGGGDIRSPINYNGTFFNSESLPQFGYNESLQIVDRNERRKRGLGDVQRMPKLEDDAARMSNGFASADWINLDTTVSTSADQIALAPGYLQRDWVDKGRHYYHYKTDAPILPYFCYLSARWQIKRGEWHGIPIEIYYDAQHGYNVRRMIEATQKSLDYYTQNFSPYQFRQVRILEFPGYSQFAQSFSNTIPFSESIGFIADLRDPENIDYVMYVTAHEMAHQWWAHQVIGGNVQGQNMLAESMSQYSALMVMEKEYGPTKMRKFLKYELDRYLRGRGGELVEELPLMRVENQPYIHYSKGSLVFYRLKDEIGEENLNRALAKFVHDKAFQRPPYTTTKEFLEYVRAVTPPEKQSLITDLFERIVFYDDRVLDATAKKRPDGKYDVKIHYTAAKFETDGKGAEKPLPVDDWMDVGVFSKRKDPDGERPPLEVEKQHITASEGTITLVVDEEPAEAGVDVYNKLIDRVPDDNRKTVRIE
jgi:hypothetical protein